MVSQEKETADVATRNFKHPSGGKPIISRTQPIVHSLGFLLAILSMTAYSGLNPSFRANHVFDRFPSRIYLVITHMYYIYLPPTLLLEQQACWLRGERQHMRRTSRVLVAANINLTMKTFARSHFDLVTSALVNSNRYR
jgi:hypothetical protein